VLVVKKLLPVDAIHGGKQMLISIVSMLIGLLKAIAPTRVRENAPFPLSAE
jgi:hypothetical protein